MYQDQKRFDQSDRLFDDALKICRSDADAAGFLHFALQHAGKNLFDQMRYADALKLFEEALVIRSSTNAPQDQIDSTLLAIKQTKKRLG